MASFLCCVWWFRLEWKFHFYFRKTLYSECLAISEFGINGRQCSLSKRRFWSSFTVSSQYLRTCLTWKKDRNKVKLIFDSKFCAKCRLLLLMLRLTLSHPIDEVNLYQDQFLQKVWFHHLHLSLHLEHQSVHPLIRGMVVLPLLVRVYQSEEHRDIKLHC